MHIVYNSVVVLVVVVVVRNEVIMIILTKECVCSLEIWVMGRKLWENIEFQRDQHRSFEKFVPHRYDPNECKECTHVNSSSMVFPRNIGGKEYLKVILKNYCRWMWLLGSGDRYFFNIFLRNVVPYIHWNW